MRPRSSPDQHLRVSDAERTQVTDRLAAHFADGRLDQAEFDQRAGQAVNARTRADLAGLLDDFPDPPLPGTGAREGRHGRPRARVLLLLVLVVAIIAIVHAAVSLLWVGLIAAIIVLVARTGRRSRVRHNR
jgi:Flp pilus assembly protein TadB